MIHIRNFAYKIIQNIKGKKVFIAYNFSLCVLSVFVYGLMEWIFLFTKPSYLSGSSISHYFNILLFIFNIAFWVSIIWILPIILLSAVSSSKSSKIFISIFSGLLPAVVVSSLCIILFDNFTYTIFSTGLFSLNGIPRALYAFLYLFIIIYWAVYFHNKNSKTKVVFEKLLNSKKFKIISFSVLIFLIIPPIIRWVQIVEAKDVVIVENSNNLENKQHIILITCEGINADHLSVYGYERNTSPRLLDLSRESLVAENAYSNSGNTAGSINSIFTSKYTTQTRMVFPPNILRGDDAFQHLPALLNSLGYQTIQIGFPYYVDADVNNMLDGFDFVNGRKSTQSKFFSMIAKNQLIEEGYFLSTLFDRILTRIRYLFFIDNAVMPFELIKKPLDVEWDNNQITKLISYFENNHFRQPLFIHIHLMGTHGPRFVNKMQKFSNEISTSKNWDSDGYDDAIYSLDFEIGRVIDYLENNGIFDDTILIITSDHGQQWTTTNRIPLIFHFPNNDFNTRLYSNTQNLDISPTILDYLNLEKPDWMQGNSLLDDLQPDRIIISAGLPELEVLPNGSITPPEMFVSPPFFQFGIITTIYCENWFQLDLRSSLLSSGKIVNSQHSCDKYDRQAFSTRTAFDLMKEHLEKNGFNTTTLVFRE